MPAVSMSDVLKDLKNSLRDLEKIQMTAPDNAELLDLKREIRQMIERAEEAAKKIGNTLGGTRSSRRILFVGLGSFSSNSVNKNFRPFDAINNCVFLFRSSGNRMISNRHDTSFGTKFAESLHKLISPFGGN
jgi:hypothetical protein